MSEEQNLNQDKMYIVNKILGNNAIRAVWDNEAEKYYLSVVDIVGVLVESKEPRKYWSWLKRKIESDDNFQVSSITRHLKLRAPDGKYRMTDVVDVEGMFRIIESIPSKNAEPIKQWLAKLGSERIDETFDPSLAIQRAADTYRAKGYDEEWINKRLHSIIGRKKLVDVWRENGVNGPAEYAILTNEIYQQWSGMTAKEYKEFKGLRKENLRDNMSDLEVLLADIGETATREIAKAKRPQGLEENKKVANTGGKIADNTRKDIEKNLGRPIVTSENRLDEQRRGLIEG